MKQKNTLRNNDPEFSKFYGRHSATGPRNSEKKQSKNHFNSYFPKEMSNFIKI